MASATTRGPVEQKLYDILNRQDGSEVTIEEVQSFVSALLDCAREDMYQHQTFAGTVVPEKR